MPETVVVFDLETVPDLAVVARVHGLDPDDTEGARAKLGTGFPKLFYQAIVCIGALVASREDGGYRVRALGAPNVGERSEAQLIADFAARLDSLRPQLVTFNGHGFDLPVMRYRAMIHGVAAPGLTCRPYLRRYDEAGLDLCDVLANFDVRGRIGLDALCRAMGLPGKTDGVNGSDVAGLVAQGRLTEVAAYCRADVVATYRIFLAYEHLCGRLCPDGYARSAADLTAFSARQDQESLTNAVRHGPARNVWADLSLRHGDGASLAIAVTDAGQSEPKDVSSTGLGIHGMRERISALSGEPTAGSLDGGFRVEAVLPLKTPDGPA